MTNLIWEWSPQPKDAHALRLEKPGAADAIRLRRLFETVKRASGGGRKVISKDAVEGFEEWLEDVARPLRSEAYALLSNWFLTGNKGARNTPLGHACADFWDAVFAVRPSKRLTSPEENHQILDDRFGVWWASMERAQGRR
ncbi:MAG TPA: hypothetical protein PLP01_04265 [Phycisphaerae bacterium]|mgnify:CR=1 FL=1|nr:hypothetical protein [Phycisphaerae bacterium]HOI54441.1 hypothetical protein [Phycisphaerae bacterium]